MLDQIIAYQTNQQQFLVCSINLLEGVCAHLGHLNYYSFHLKDCILNLLVLGVEGIRNEQVSLDHRGKSIGATWACGHSRETFP